MLNYKILNTYEGALNKGNPMSRPALTSDDEPIDITGQAEDVSGISDDNENELRSVLAGLGGDPNEQNVYVRVLKQQPGFKRPFECFTINSAEMDTLNDRLRNEFGTGVYICNIVRNGRLYKKIELPILAPNKPKEGSGPTDLAVVIKTLQESQSRMYQQMQEIMLQSRGQQVAPTDPMTLMSSMLAMMASMKEFIAPPQGNQFEQFLRTIEVVKDIMPERGGGGETNFLDVIRDALPVIGEAIGAQTTAPSLGLSSPPPQARLTNPPPQPQPQVQPRPQPQPQVQPRPQAQPPQEDDPVLKQIAMARSYINTLVGWAQKGFDPLARAYIVLEEVDEQTIATYLLADDAIDKAASLDARVNQHRVWFVKFQTELRRLMSETPEGENEFPEGEDEPPAA